MVREMEPATQTLVLSSASALCPVQLKADIADETRARLCGRVLVTYAFFSIKNRFSGPVHWSSPAT
eukprot:3430499-Rhodomonas_salina.1